MEILLITDIVLNSVVIGLLWWSWAQESKKLPPYFKADLTYPTKNLIGETDKKPFKWIKIR